MKIKDYPEWVEGKIITSGQTRVIENILGIIGESGEIAEKVKKLHRDSTRFSNEDIAKELGDVVFYCTAVGNMLHIDMPLYAEAIKVDKEIPFVDTVNVAMMMSSVGRVAESLPTILQGHKIPSDLEMNLQDVILWIVQLASHFDYDMQGIIDLNVEKLDGREERGTIQGSGDNR
jgi:NTP pyrophosphatase (non-canonical NTP hydrolase)